MEIIKSIVRPIVGLGFVGMFAYLLITNPTPEVVTAAIATTGVVVGFYFGERSQKGT